jgi:hypothetical protein
MAARGVCPGSKASKKAMTWQDGEHGVHLMRVLQWNFFRSVFYIYFFNFQMSSQISLMSPESIYFLSYIFHHGLATELIKILTMQIHENSKTTLFCSWGQDFSFSRVI